VHGLTNRLPFVEDGGREYLFGVVTADDDRNLVYKGRWALDRAQERAAFEEFIDSVFDRMRRFPDLHIYHFGTYEPGAIKRLMLRYATREEDVDRLLRGEFFIDLHSITKRSVRASVEEYSLKEMEKFCDYTRKVGLRDANQARHFIEHQLELSTSPALTDEACGLVEGYNEDDCRATERLRHWLEGLRAKLVASGTEVPRPAAKDTSPSDEVNAHQRRVVALFDALTQGLPAEPRDRNPEQAARWLLAHALDWHRREEKVKWWEFFRMKEVSEEDPLMLDRIKDAVNGALTAKGWTQVDSGGDVSVVAMEITQKQQTLNTFYDGFGGGWRRWGGFGNATTTTETYKVGTLIVDLFDTKTKDLIWRGSASDTVSDNSDKNIKNLGKGVQKMFKHFPPDAKK